MPTSPAPNTMLGFTIFYGRAQGHCLDTTEANVEHVAPCSDSPRHSQSKYLHHQSKIRTDRVDGLTSSVQSYEYKDAFLFTVEEGFFRLFASTMDS